MGCSASTVPPAAVPAGKASEDPKVEEPTAAAPPPAQAEADAPSEPKVAKERRASAKTRIKDMCDEGWLEIAEAYCACQERGDEWGSTEADAVLKERGGEGFENARITFGTTPLPPPPGPRVHILSL